MTEFLLATLPNSFCPSRLPANNIKTTTMMKSVLLLLLSLALVSGFSILQPSAPTSTALCASRAAQKKAARSKWLEKRGFGDEGAAAVAEVEASEDEDDDEDDDEGEEEAEAEEEE